MRSSGSGPPRSHSNSSVPPRSAGDIPAHRPTDSAASQRPASGHRAAPTSRPAPARVPPPTGRPAPPERAARTDRPPSPERARESERSGSHPRPARSVPATDRPPSTERPASAAPRPAAASRPPAAPRPAPAAPRPAASPKDGESGFAPLGLSPEMMEALVAAAYEQPTPIQAGLIPRALTGVDVLGQARTGTGKTAAFVIPILERLRSRKELHGPQALILVPTRELAVQVRGEVEKLAAGKRTHCAALHGGVPIRGQIEKLQRGAEVIVGTPGRVIDHIERRTLILEDLQCVVLDEADRMLDIGFRPDIERILRRCPSERQTLLLSATLPPPILKLAERYMRSPEHLNYSPKEVAVDTIDQYYFTVDQERKFDLLLKLLDRENPQQAIVFCRTKRGVDKIARRLSKQLDHVACMHGDMRQSQRDRTMADFRAGKVGILVATDVVGRGIDVTGVSHIVNFDIPEFSDDYVHRVGRTGRMGREGIAFTFVTPEQGAELTRIEERINKLLKRGELEGFELVAPRRGPRQPALDAEGKPLPEGPAPPPPLYDRGGRGRKRYRRAL